MFRRRKTKVPSSRSHHHNTRILSSKPESSPTSVAAADASNTRLPIVITVNEKGNVPSTYSSFSSSSAQPRQLFASTTTTNNNDNWSACSRSTTTSVSAYTDPRGGTTTSSRTSTSRRREKDLDYKEDDEEYYYYYDEDANISQTSRASSLNSFDIRLLEIAARIQTNFAAVADKLSFVETILDKLQCKSHPPPHGGDEGSTTILWKVPCTSSTSPVIDDDENSSSNLPTYTTTIPETAQFQRNPVVSAAATRFAKVAELANSLQDPYSASPAVPHNLSSKRRTNSRKEDEPTNPTVVR